MGPRWKKYATTDSTLGYLLSLGPTSLFTLPPPIYICVSVSLSCHCVSLCLCWSLSLSLFVSICLYCCLSASLSVHCVCLCLCWSMSLYLPLLLSLCLLCVCVFSPHLYGLEVKHIDLHVLLDTIFS